MIDLSQVTGGLVKSLRIKVIIWTGITCLIIGLIIGAAIGGYYSYKELSKKVDYLIEKTHIIDKIKQRL